MNKFLFRSGIKDTVKVDFNNEIIKKTYRYRGK